MKANWRFPLTSGGAESGFNDAGIENFAGEPFNSLGREIIQNSLDAVDDEKKEVVVSFRSFALTRSQFPDIDNLNDAIDACKSEIEKADLGQKAFTFFGKAQHILASKTIPFLRIDDSNTLGLRINNENPKKGSFYAITKGRGTSVKPNDLAGGSYGIGQNAPFVVSALRTVFYSSHYITDDSQEKDIFQGKSILMSHKDRNGNETQGIGFLGIGNNLDPMINGDVPKDFRRNEQGKKIQGTSIIIAGFDAPPDWRYLLSASVATNFFVAIYDGRLKVLIDEEYCIDKDSLELLFEETDIIKRLDDSERVGFLHAKSYLHTYINGQLKERELPNLGYSKLWLMVDENVDEESEKLEYPRRVALIRNGMLITDQQKGINRTRGVKDYVGLFICQSKAGNEMLRSMEPPAHDRFESKRAGDPKLANKMLADMKKFIRETVAEIATKSEGTITKLDELEKYLPNLDAAEQIPDHSREGERNPEGKTFVSIKPIRRRSHRPVRRLNGDADTNGVDKDDTPLITQGEGKNAESNSKKRDSSSKNRSGGRSEGIQLLDVRCIVSNADSTIRMISFTASKDSIVSIALEIAGDTDFEKLEIVDAGRNVDIANGKIEKLQVKGGARQSLSVRTSVPHQGAIRVVSDEV